MTFPRADVRERLHLAQANRSALALMLGRGMAAGLDVLRVVAIVADQRDEVGRQLAEFAARQVGLNAAVEGTRAEDRGEVPTAILVVDVDSAVAIFTETHPSVAAGLSNCPPPGCVRVVAIAAGGATLLHCEVSPVIEADA